MRNSSLGQVWKGTKMLRSLKILNLSYSHGLANSPDFSQVPNLEKLTLKDCINLVGVHESIGKLERLVLLNLKGCKNLRKFPRNIVQLKSLEKLVLSDCSRLDKLPPDLGKMESLKGLHADGINQLSSSTGEVKPWYEHVWSWVSKPRRSTESICFSLTSLPRSLVKLNLANCNLSSDGIPGDLSTLSSLQYLYLNENSIDSLPGSLKGLTSLLHLELNRCTWVQSLPELPMSLAGVSLAECRSLEIVANLPNLFNQLNFDIDYCEKLVEVQGLFKLEGIGNIDSEMINNLSLTELDSMGMLEVELVRNLTGPIKKAVDYCEKLVEVQGLFKLEGIANIDSEMINNLSLTELDFMGMLEVELVSNLTGAVDFEQAEWSCECIKISNKTKGLKRAYSPLFRDLAYEDKDVIWLSDWKMIVSQLMEDGDEVNVSVNMEELFEVKEFGIRVLYNEEEGEGTQNNTGPTCHQNVIDLSAYQKREGEYFLSNHDSIGRAMDYERISGPKWDCLETTGEKEVKERG